MNLEEFLQRRQAIQERLQRIDRFFCSQPGLVLSDYDAGLVHHAESDLDDVIEVLEDDFEIGRIRAKGS